MRKYQQKFNKELLTGQKLKKRWHAPPCHPKHILILTCLISLSILAIEAKDKIGSLAPLIELQSTHPWKIRIRHLDKDSSISESERQRIESSFQDLMNRQNQILDLDNLAKLIIRDSEYSKIHIYRTDQKSLTISLSSHLPVMKTQADKMRYISEDLVIFGNANKSDLPELIGLTEISIPKKSKNNPNEVVLEKRERDLAIEALELKRLVEKQNIHVSKIILKKYRGFYVLTKESNILISFGHQPFAGKIKKLIKILDDLSRSSRVASAIELDFEDKAFVKELKL